MQYEIYVIKDKAAGSFLKPHFFVNDSMIIRELQSCTMDPEHNFSKHSSDFSLWKLGTFDDETATIIPLKDHLCVMQMDDIKNLK